MTSYKRLLAKSTQTPDKPRPGESYQGHTAEVIKAAKVIAEARGKSSLEAVRLSSEVSEERLRKILQLAAFIHDLGKCSNHFQAMVRGGKQGQLLRHEAASLWLCWPGQPLAAWLRGAVATDEDYLIAVIAAAAHHRKFWENAFAAEGSGGGSQMQLLCSHKDFKKNLHLAKNIFQLNDPPNMEDISIKISAIDQNSPEKMFRKWEVDCEAKFPLGQSSSILLSITKVLLICADIAGSALPKGEFFADEPTQWLAERFRDEDIREGLTQVIAKRLEGRNLRLFQEKMASSDAPITLVKAGCGSGKTVGAFAWAARQHPRRRLWITYPTTGTATEGFRDYVNLSELHGKLIHGRAEVDVELFDLRDGEDEGPRHQDRLASLREWGLDVVTCTVDTVLGLIQNNRRGTYAWPNIAQGAVVFDEIHAYDDQLFGALLRFLEALPGVPALLMTASLPAFRQRALENLCHRIHGRSLAEISGPEELETLPRYRLHEPISSLEQALEEIQYIRAQGGKVLWVSNTVNRCMEAARRSRELGETLIYHSRFRYRDRVLRHGEVINAFDPKKNQDFVVACTTQVAEMSLDLSADLLITDLAPIPSMIQRLGRLNRRSTPQAPAVVRRFLVLKPDLELPYSQAELDEAEQWLEALKNRDLNQTDLVSAWNQPDEGSSSPCESAWLDGGFRTCSEPLRKAGDGITILLPQDRDDVIAHRTRAIEVAVPMNRPPRSLNWTKWERSKATSYLPVPPPETIHYDPKEGARWVEK
jgi:CRISPR-associated endonuclease/helicase Cas3